MRALSIIILIFTFSNTLHAQLVLDSLVLTKEQNAKWINQLEKEIKSKQLELIKQRILIDTNIYVVQSYPDRVRFDSEKEKGLRTEGYGRPLLVINGQLAPINNRTKNESIIDLANLLTNNKIVEVSIMKDLEAMAIYGSRAVCGVIIMTTNDKMILKKIRKIDLGEY